MPLFDATRVRHRGDPRFDRARGKRFHEDFFDAPQHGPPRCSTWARATMVARL